MPLIICNTAVHSRKFWLTTVAAGALLVGWADYGAASPGTIVADNTVVTESNVSASTTGNSQAAVTALNGGTANLTNLSAITQGLLAYGAYANGNGYITIDGGSIYTLNTTGHLLQGADARSYALYANGASAYIDASNIEILTLGQRSYGAYALGGAEIELANVNIRTEGFMGYGIYASGNESSITASNVNITTVGSVGNAVWAYDHAAVSINGGIIQVTGSANITTPYEAAAALTAYSHSTILGNNLTITVNGNGNAPIIAMDHSIIGLIGSTIAASGNSIMGVTSWNESGVYIYGTTISVAGSDNTVLIAGGTVEGLGNGNGIIDASNSSILVTGNNSIGAEVSFGGQLYLRESTLSSEQGVGVRLVDQATVQLHASTIQAGAETFVSTIALAGQGQGIELIGSSATVNDGTLWRVTRSGEGVDGIANLSLIGGSVAVGNIIDESDKSGDGFTGVLIDASRLTGTLTGVDRLRLAGGGVWNATGAGQIGEIVLETAGGTIGVQDGSITLPTPISGDGMLTKDGSGTLVLTGTNTYTGGTTIAAGTLALSGSGSIAASSGVGIAPGATFDISATTAGASIAGLSGAGSVQLGGQSLTLTNAGGAFSGGIHGAGGLVLAGGMQTLSGVNTYVGGTTISGGTLTGSATSFGTGHIINNAALVLNQATGGTLPNVMSGTGTLTKVGAGTLTLTGDSSGFAGATTLAGGGLAVNGSLAGSVVTARAGTVLSGSGTVGGIVAQRGATIAPGNSPGTLTVAGSFRQGAGAIYAAEVVPGGTASDRIAVQGAATLDSGAILDVSKYGGGAYSIDAHYTVLTAAGGVSGTYAVTGDTRVSAFYTLLARYDATAVYLDAVQTRSFAAAGATRNQRAAAGAVQSLDRTNGLRFAVGSLQTDAQARIAFDALSGEAYASIRSAIIEDSRFVRNASVDRLRTAFGGVGASTNAMACRGSAGAYVEGSNENCEGVAFWTQAFGGWGRTSGDGNVGSLTHDTGGIVMGADLAVLDGWRVGLLGGYSHSNYDVESRNSRGSSDNYSLGLYGGTQWGALGLRLGAAYTWSDGNARRGIGFTGFSEGLRSDFDAQTAQGFGELGYRIDLGETGIGTVAFEPFAGLAYVNTSMDGFTERGGAAALTGRSEDSGVTFATLGLRGATRFAVGETQVTASGALGWRHAWGDVTPTSSFRFAGSDAFDVGGTPVAKDAALIEAGISAAVSSSMVLGVSYTGQFGDGAQSQGIRGSLTIRF